MAVARVAHQREWQPKTLNPNNGWRCIAWRNRSNYSIIDPADPVLPPTVHRPRLCEQSPQAPLSAEDSPPDSSEGHTPARGERVAKYNRLLEIGISGLPYGLPG
jgi:hypothetical protein